MSGKTEVAAEAVGASIGSKVIAGGATTGAVAYVATGNWLGLCGLLIAALGLLANLYFQHKRERREAAEGEARQRREDAESAARIRLEADIRANFALRAKGERS